MTKHDFTDIETQLRDAFRNSPEMHDIEAPEDFLSSVMESLPCEREEKHHTSMRSGIISFWSMLRNAMTRPVSITTSPLQVMAALLIIICSVTTYRIQSVPEYTASHSTVRLQPVEFTLPDPDKAFTSAVVIGSFNHWQETGFEMKYDTEKRAWILEHELPAGEYQYIFLVDGNAPVSDPSAALYVNDSFGNQNALLQVRGAMHEL
ncbi:isoamylase early set domain-containing protein [Halodesulfovibrio spirochaetisodalis]|uniref:isoamylase early set domain-containing protein n=1 Tax=Halodesulfovibrio spirochaetisodalis TaxID=1560234 RepID=UPI00082E928D|nr:isoamylase early set domain-containing protein [Halodesulfovibrio spirochaetisodalis]